MVLKHIISFLSMGLLVASCSPKVVSIPFAAFPETTTSDEIRVYHLGEDFPADAEVIGQVVVKDPGYSKKCDYREVVEMAKEATAEIGGNALAITEHAPPAFFGSLTHQISGAVLIETADSRLGNTTLQMDEMKMQSTHFMNNPLDAAEAAREASIGRYDEDPIQERRYRIQMQKKNSFYAAIGYARMMSRVPVIGIDGDALLNGVNYQVGYNYIFPRLFGLGLAYTGYYSKSSNNTNPETLQHHLPNLQLLLQFKLNKNSGVGLKFGLGPAIGSVSSGIENQVHVGMGMVVGLDYIYFLSDQWALCANADFTYSTIFMDQTVESMQVEKSQVAQNFEFFNLGAGVRWFF